MNSNSQDRDGDDGIENMSLKLALNNRPKYRKISLLQTKFYVRLSIEIECMPFFVLYFIPIEINFDVK